MANLFKKTYQRIESYFLENASLQKLNVQAVVKGGGKSGSLTTQPEDLQRQTLKEWKTALLAATDQEYPDRSMLQTLYENLMLDSHLASTIESRILHSQRAPFKITDSKGDESEELSDLFKRPWFENFIKYALDSRFEGVQLIELFEISPETREILEIERIPIAHFNAKKGVILKQVGDMQGWPYTEGALKPHYLQVGKANSLGILAKIAPVVLGKKMGWGSWLDYLDKYGVGNLFVTTEHQDMQSLKRLEEAARNFKANGWMVTNGNEDFEIKGSEAANPQTFDLLIERANSEISKRILGGSGISDEKSFVGSAEIQFKLAEDRYNSDLMMLENLINQELFPRLIKISPAYAALENYRFQWEDKPEDKKELRDTVASLAPHFDLDVDELSQRLGITLLKQRSGGGFGDFSGGDRATEKKKAKPKMAGTLKAVDASYHAPGCGCGDCEDIKVTAIDTSGWTKVMERIAREVYDGKLKEGDLDDGHILKTYQELNGAAKEGYGKDYTATGADGMPAPEVLQMKKNIYRFSGAKDATMLHDLNKSLRQGGKMKSWNTFKKHALNLNKTYNVNHLQAEWQTGKQAGYMANLWQEYQDNADLYPALEYRTQGDDRVRPEHEVLDGTVKALDDPFWDSYYPPNGWRCRCYTVQTAAKPTPEEDTQRPNKKQVKPEFRKNVGKKGEVFKEGSKEDPIAHPYFRLAKETGYARAFELNKLNAPKHKIKTNNGSFKVNIFADKRDLNKNMDIAKLSTEKLNHQININAHVNLKKIKNPELSDKNALLGDRVSPEWKGNVANVVNNAFKDKLSNKKNGQLSKLDHTFITVEANFKNTTKNVRSFSKQSWEKFKHYTALDYVVYYRGNKAVKIDRDMIDNGFKAYAEKIESIF